MLVGKALARLGRQGAVALAGASDDLGIPQVSQKPESQGGVGCSSWLVLPLLATAGKPWAVPTGS